MRIALTGATGFLGRYLVQEFLQQGHECRCWFRPSSDRSGMEQLSSGLSWVPGELGVGASCRELVAGCEALVHAALYHPGGGFRGGEGDLIEFARRNVLGSLELFEAARTAGCQRVVFISTCAVHEKILDDRPLDETHPTWAASHYGASKAAVEQFVVSYGLGHQFPICTLRPCGIYGVSIPIDHSKWFPLIRDVVAGRTIQCRGGGKEVHASDVARAANLLLHADPTAMAGQAFNCCDRYVSQWEVATLARELCAEKVDIRGQSSTPKHNISTGKLAALGMRFGGQQLLAQTIRQLVQACQQGD